MTRGMFFIVVPDGDDMKVYVSTEFNGDMYIEKDSCGEDAVKNFTNETVKSLDDFKKFVEDFNSRNYQYDDCELVGEANSTTDELMFKGVTDIFNITNYCYHSDYSFWRNLTDSIVEIKADNGIIQIQPGDGAVFNYNEFYDMHNSDFENQWGAMEIRDSNEAIRYVDDARIAELVDEYNFTEEEAQELITYHMDKFHEVFCIYGYLEDIADAYLDDHDVNDYIRGFVDLNKLGRSLVNNEDCYYLFECSERVLYYQP